METCGRTCAVECTAGNMQHNGVAYLLSVEKCIEYVYVVVEFRIRRLRTNYILRKPQLKSTYDYAVLRCRYTSLASVHVFDIEWAIFWFLLRGNRTSHSRERAR